MKSKMIIVMALSGIGLLSFTGCNKDKGNGQLRVEMTDAPADFTEVNVNITEVWAHYNGSGNSGSGWVQLDANPGMYNLLALQNDVTAVIADPTTIPVGSITQVRLILGDGNHAVEVIDSVTVEYPLLLSSQDKTGLKINLNSDIHPNETIVVVLDFDAESSIVSQGNGGYRLKPVIKVEDVYYVP